MKDTMNYKPYKGLKNVHIGLHADDSNRTYV